MLHGQHELGQQFARVVAHDGRAEDAVLARRRQHLHEAVGFVVGDGAVQVVQLISRDLDCDLALGRVALVQADPRDLGLDEGRRRDHAVVGRELLERVEQRVHRRVPGLVCRRVRELVRAGHVAGGVDVGQVGLQVAVHLDGLGRGHAQFFEPVAGEVGAAPNRHQQRIERQAHLAPFVFGNQRALAVRLVRCDLDALGGMAQAHIDALGREARQHDGRHVVVFAHQQARRHLDLGDARAEPREGLRQFAADRPAAQHQQALGAHAQVPDVVGREHLDLLDAWQLRHERPRPGGDDDGPRGQPLHRAVGVRHFHFPRARDARRALGHVHAQFGVARDRVVRLDGLDDALHTFHHLGKVELGVR